MADQTADSRTITGTIVEALIDKGLATRGDTKQRAEEVAEAYKIIWKAVNDPSP